MLPDGIETERPLEAWKDTLVRCGAYGKTELAAHRALGDADVRRHPYLTRYAYVKIG